MQQKSSDDPGAVTTVLDKNKQEKREVLAHQDKVETQRRLIIACLLFTHLH
jgi:hypothetical protein